MPGAQLIQDHAQRINITPLRDGILAQLFGARVARGKQHHLSYGLLSGTLQQFGRAKIEQFDNAFFTGYQNVRWLEIAVDNQILMRMLNCCAHL